VHSLSRRLLVSVLVSLVLFFGVTIAVLDMSFRALSERSLQDLLDAQMVALIAATEPRESGVFSPPPGSLESRLDTPGSGLYAQIRAAGTEESWRSPSTAGAFIDFGGKLDPGVKRFSYSTADDERIAVASRGIAFEDEGQDTRNLTFSVAASLVPYDRQLRSFRTQLFGWFLGLTLLLLATLGALLRWVLRPVRRLEKEIHDVEEGERETLGDGYPRELTGVAGNLNALLIGERKRVARYRDTLGNLAHSLKTPLAVMRTTLGSKTRDAADIPQSVEATLSGEIDRMTAIIEHQLQRAAASGGSWLGQAPLDVAAVVTDLRSALLKVYARKDLSIEVQIAPGAQFVGDRGDLMEVLGNLLDNACKWCKSRVRLTVSVDSSAPTRTRLVIVVEDDGPGISEADRARVLERGVRMDERVPGHGIGLSMVHDAVDLYGGTLTIDASDLGGACFSLRLPGR